MSLFIILIVGAYFVTGYDMGRQTRFVSERIMADLQAGFLPGAQPRGPQGPGPGPGPLGLPPGPPIPPPGVPPEVQRGPHFFFVKTSPAGAITGQSNYLPINLGELPALTAEVLAAKAERGVVSLAGVEFSYLRRPLADGGGQVIVFHDRSQDKEMQRVLLTALMVVGAVCSLLSFGASFVMAERAMLPIRRAWEQQKDFLSDASHELRSPLAVIQTNLDVVRLKPEETVASQDKWLDNVQEEVAYMAKLVDSLLFLARAESAQQPLVRRLFAYDDALLRAAAPFEAVAAAKGVALVVASAVEITGYGDEARIRQVVGILLDNAIRHTPSGGKVTVSLSRADSRAFLTVADTGEGIAPEYLDKVFDRFFQVDKARAKGGAGLGLAIAKWIVESHGGGITAASTPGQGSTFSFWLPLEKA